MTLELARRLIASGAASPRDVEAALYLSVVRGVSLARALVDRGVLSERALEDELVRRAGAPLRQITPSAELAARLPRGMCRMLAAVPVAQEGPGGPVEVAAVDAHDPHVVQEFAFHLGVPVRARRATMAAVEEAIRRLELGDGATSARSRRRTPAFPHGAPESVPPSPLPPSQAEEVPIPLVRRVGAPPVPTIPYEDDEEARREAPVSEGPTARPSEAQGLLARSSLDPDEVAAPRPSFVAPVTSAPAVSFPSSPPPAFAPEAERAVGPSFAAPVARPTRSSTPPGGFEAPPPSTPRPSMPPPAPPDADGEGPETLPRTPDAGWSPSLPELLDLLTRARSRDDLLDLVLRALTLVARRAAVFVVRKEGYVGWACNPAFGAEEDLRSIVLPAGSPSVLATAAAAGYYLGAIPQTAIHAPLLAVLGATSPDVAVWVARVKGRPVLVLVADELDDTLVGTRALEEIAARAGESLTRLIGRPA